VCESIDALKNELVRSRLGEETGKIIRLTGIDGFRRVCQQTHDLDNIDTYRAFDLAENAIPLLNAYGAEGYEKLALFAQNANNEKQTKEILGIIKNKKSEADIALIGWIHDQSDAQIVSQLIDMKKYKKEYAEKVGGFF
jgi:hypothetical protein